MTSLKEGKTQYYRFNLNNPDARTIAYLQAKFLAEGLAEHLGEMGIPTLKEVNQKPSGVAEKEKSMPISAVPA